MTVNGKLSKLAEEKNTRLAAMKSRAHFDI